MSLSHVATIILAAGKGSRMNSEMPKVLHPVAGIPMIGHLIAAVDILNPEISIVVVSPEQNDVVKYVSPINTTVQNVPLGTGHAVSAAISKFRNFEGDVLVLFGDTPLITCATMQAMIDARRAKENPAAVVLGFRCKKANAYGRLVLEDGKLVRIVEVADASPEQLQNDFCNSGIMVFDGKRLEQLLGEISNTNSTGEYYLTDVISIAREKGWLCKALEAPDYLEVMGVNSRSDLAMAEAAMQIRLRNAAMKKGTTLIDPSSVWFSADTIVGKDITIAPNVWFGLGVHISNNVSIRSFCHIEGAFIDEYSVIGPFARLRPGANIGREVSIGNYVEVKNTTVKEHVKINHLAYVGDSTVEAEANIGAGAITCNYDGIKKTETKIGKGAFIGSNTALVAPVTVGDGAIIGAGSTITDDVPADALALTRATADVREGWANRFRRGKSAKIKNKGP